MLEDARRDGIVSTLIAGFIVGVIVVIVSISLATLVFAGELSDHLAQGIGLYLLSGALTTGLIALTSSYPGMIAYPQGRVAPILALVALAIVGTLSGHASSEQLFLTVVAAIVAVTLVNGLFLLAMGVLRLGGLIGFIPYPVIGGFLAGTGWLLVRGSLGVMTSLEIDRQNASLLLEVPYSGQAIAGITFGLILVLTGRRSHHHLVLPGLLLGGVTLFYGLLFVLGVPIDIVEAGGWLLGPLPESRVWSFVTWDAFIHANWSAILSQSGSLLTILLIVVVSVLLNSRALELVVRRDIDLNRELCAAGAANLLAGALGGTVGFHSLSTSRLVHSLRVKNRLAGVAAAAICLAVLFAGTATLDYLPRAILGGLLFFLGMEFLVEWLVDAWSRLERSDYVVVVLILACIAGFGYIQGVTVGVVACIVLFLVNYSRVDVVKHTLAGADHPSNVDRPSRHQQLLNKRAGQIAILKLQGFIFFGTASGLLDRVRSIVERPASPEHDAVRYMVLDFKSVSAIDSSSTLSFVKLLQLAEQRRFTLILSDVKKPIQKLLESEGFATASEDAFRLFDDLDHAIEWCENQILLGQNVAVDEYNSISLGDQLRESLPDSFDIDRVLSYFDRLEIAAGEHLLRQGDDADALYMIDRGQVTAQLEIDPDDPTKTVRLRTMCSGTIVGEVGLILGEPRTASVIADEPTTVYRLSSESFDRMKREDPALGLAFHAYLTHLMAERLSNTARALQTFME